MTDPVAAPPEYTAPALATAPKKNTIGFVAFGLAVAGFLLAVIPGPSAVAWLLLVPAIILGIIALVQKRKPLWPGLVAVILGPIAWIIAIIISLAGFASGISDAVNDEVDNPGIEAPVEDAPAEEAPAEEAPSEATLGQTLTNNDGVAVTFSSVTCGIPQAGPEFLEETAKGQFCEVKYNVQNGSADTINLFASDVTGEIGGISYEANGTASTFGGDYFTTDLNPGLGVDAVMYIDIPVDQALEYVVFVPQWSLFTDDIRVKVS